ncbi:MAG: hypothetical protein FJX21_13445 [Alphaproteobacteria bacterium]|nr:hypothetical protein [Alphaproteobacteria bacterium]
MTDVPRDHPDAAGLLAAAREEFAREIQPFLKDDLRLSGLMIASALSMAERELRRPPDGFLDAWPLVHALRAGRHDGDGNLHARLLDDARRRLAIANPRYLSDRV